MTSAQSPQLASVHSWVARSIGRVLGFEHDSDEKLARYLESDATAQMRMDYADLVNAAWGIVGFAFGVATVVMVALVHNLGNAAEGVVAVVGLTATFFCLAGCVYVLWRKHFAKQARRRARKTGTDSPGYAASIRRSLPRNGSIWFQAAVGLLTAVIAGASYL